MIRDVGDTLPRVIARAQEKVRHIAVDRAANLRASQVDLGLIDLLLGRLECRLRLDRGSGEDLLLFGAGREIGQALPPCGLDLLYLQIGRLLPQRCRCGAHGHLEVVGVDHVQHVAPMDELVVGDPQVDDLARDLRGHAGDLHADPAVPGPGRVDVVVPDHQRRDDRDSQDGQRGQPSGKMPDPCGRGAALDRRRPVRPRRLMIRPVVRFLPGTCSGPERGRPVLSLVGKGECGTRRRRRESFPPRLRIAWCRDFHGRGPRKRR